jgi:enamine deaminase RidA (YjgF/YER057c/UK114 family)
MNAIADRLAELKLELPSPAAAVANYVGAVRSGSLLFVSGQLPLAGDGKIAAAHNGRLDEHSPVEGARDAARVCALNVLAQARSALGDLDQVARVIRLGGFFSAQGRYDSLSTAMNGASDLMVAVFGERGRHARSAVGVASLPLGALAEIEALFELKP